MERTIKKAYQIDLERLEEGYLTDSIICHAENLNKAKAELLKIVKYDDLKLKYSGEELSYLNIPVKRRKSSDIVIFEDNEIIRFEIETLKRERERISELNLISENPNVKYCYIYKGGYYRPNSCGYSDNRHFAGVYTKEDAISSAKSCREIKIIPIDIIEHNEMINGVITDLKSRLIEVC